VKEQAAGIDRLNKPERTSPMIIKKFQGKTENEATAAAKKELGDSIVIMNVKNIKKKKLFGIFGEKLVEVTVAKEEENQKVPAVFPERKEISSPIVPDSVWERAELQKEVAATEDTGKAIVEKLDGLQVLLKQQLRQSEEEETRLKELDEPVREEKLSPEMLTFMKLLYNTMLDNEVRDKYADQMLDEVEKNITPNMQIDFALSTIYQKMILKFGKAELIKEGEKKPKLLFFIGPTGVGKTTTIAKISSRLCVREKKKIALLTADTYRIAAAEQLRTYANILEVPFRIVYSPEEVAGAAEEFKNYDYILVDTSGHSYQNEAQKNDIKDLIHAMDDSVDKEVFLVLSATTKYRDLVHIADAYKAITEYKLIFTKLDETSALGNLYNLHLYTGAPMSYVTCGQNVPDDIAPFSPQATVKQILSSNEKP
jgi:flagellar biosynthesis protein FlhF